MIEKIDRKTIFSQIRNSASAVAEIQKAFYEDDLGAYESETEKTEYLSMFDLLDEPIEPNKSFNTIISFDHSELESYPETLSHKLVTLFSDLKTSGFMVLSHLKTNFFGEPQTKHIHLKKAYSNLEQIVGSQYFDEGFKIATHDLEVFIPMVFWMQRIDSRSPEFLFFFDDKNRFSFYLCNYGKVHLTSFKKQIFTSNRFKKNGWIEIDRCINSLS